mgnify:CR=1 FL=1
MTLILTPQQAQYIDTNGVCSGSSTPPGILAELKKIDQNYFDAYKKHLIQFEK